MDGTLQLEVEGEEEIHQLMAIEEQLHDLGIEFDTGVALNEASNRYVREWQLDGIGQQQIRFVEKE